MIPISDMGIIRDRYGNVLLINYGFLLVRILILFVNGKLCCPLVLTHNYSIYRPVVVWL